MTHLWEVDHDYYCEESNYFASGDKTISEYESWSDFVGVWGDPDMDYNLLFRWDWKDISEDDESPTWPKEDDHYRGYKLYLFWMVQRKGLYQASIIRVCRADEPLVLEFLRPRWEHLRKLWRPFGEEL